jgi:hypothetical protein
VVSIPDGEDTTGLSKAGLLVDTTDALLEQAAHFGGSGLALGGIGASDDGGDAGLVVEKSVLL